MQHPLQQIPGNTETDLKSEVPDLFDQSGIFH